MDYTKINARTIDRWVDQGWQWGIPISHEQYLQVLQGEWQMVLTPNKPVPREWFPELKGKHVLGLASGGGQQMPVFAALGAVVTVLDISERQLESERMVAEREGYAIEIVKAEMTKKLPFEDARFDLIFHPVSNCYIEEVIPLWQECMRILKPGGYLLAGMDNGFNYLFDEDEQKVTGYLPFNPLKNEDQLHSLQKSDEGIQFSHTLEEQLAGQLKAGLRLLDLYEDTNSEGYLSTRGVPTFWASLAVKP